MGTTHRWAETKKNLRELACFWERGALGASGFLEELYFLARERAN